MNAPATPANPATPAMAPAPAPTNSKRAKALKGVALVVLLGLAYGGYEWYLGRHEEATDNAYVQGNVVQITPQVGAGPVSSCN